MKELMLMVSSLLVSSALAGQDFRSSKDDYLRMAQYLSDDTGRWMATNPGYDSTDTNATKALGLWFDFTTNEQILSLAIVSYRGDTAYVTSESFWIWHAGEQRIKYHYIDIYGTVTEGETYFNSENEFVTRSFVYLPDGTIHFTRGINVILRQDLHFTKSLTFKENDWEENAGFLWRRALEGEGYKIVKHY